MLLYDKSGEEHYNLISALHKSVRNSDASATLYWLGRMLEAGEDPLYIARRILRMASEDIGMADPNALSVTVAAMQAVHFMGMPEGNLALAEAAVYLALAPKSNALYVGYGEVARDAQETMAEPVPLHLRNAVTGMMANFGYGKGYQYAHKAEEKLTDMQCLPDNLKDSEYYRPTDQGLEKRLKEKMQAIEEWKKKQANEKCEG
jgi:putative ATPase